MTALEEIKKAFPNMFRPLKWHHFDGPTEHGCGEWYAHATRGMYHIYDVREKFPNDRPFYAKELSDQFDTLELAQDAVQNRHELDIVMCLDPDFRSTIESLQRENAILQERTADYPTISARLHDREKARDAEQKACREAIARAEAAEAEVKRLCQVLKPFAEASAWNAEGVDLTQGDRPAFPSDIDLMNLEGNSLTLCDLFDARDALASTGGEHHAE